MWNPFRRKPPAERFPEPQWSPIQELDGIDLTGKRRDGGVDLVIVASQPIDGSPPTLESIRHKVRTYLAAIDLEKFQAELGHPPRDQTTILITCDHAVHPRALTTIAQCRAAAAAQGVRLELRKSINSPPIPLPEGGDEMLQSIRPAARADQDRIAAQADKVLGMVRSRYGDVRFRSTEDDLRLLQRLYDDGALDVADADREEELGAVGIVFGLVVAARLPLRWVTVEWQGERLPALQYPGTAVVIFPGSMIAKRINRGEAVEFESLFRATLAQVEQMKDDPEYKR